MRWKSLAALACAVAGCTAARPLPTALPPPPPPPPPAVVEPVVPPHPDDEEPITNIEIAFQRASNKALTYAGESHIDADTLSEIRSLYVQAGSALTVLKIHKRGRDYGAAREAVNALSDYINAHPPSRDTP
jgi:hypothetical protein